MNKEPVVLSASRRVEMVGFFPDRLADFLEKRRETDTVHTVVLWSKSPANILRHKRLASALQRVPCFLQLTISGMGGSRLEPGIPDMGSVLSLLQDLIAFLGNPERIRLRFDPIVHFDFGTIQYSNLEMLPVVLRESASAGIADLVVSWMQEYPRALRRLENSGIRVLPVSMIKRVEESEWIRDLAAKEGFRLHGCCVPELPVSACIDGRLLTSLHPEHRQADLRKAGGQRALCGCTRSWDIGWYYPCPGGCLYCYANPVRIDSWPDQRNDAD